MEPSKDAISVRVTRLNNQVLGKQNDHTEPLTREGLFDALQVLYDECNTETMKNNDRNIASFIDKYRKKLMQLKKLRVNLTDFDVKNVIGRGHFGEVHVVKERQTGDVYAMKTVRKYENSEQKCAAFAEERNIMVEANSLWITKLQYAFQDANNLYYIMEYHPGGDLVGLLYRQGGTIPETAATFYLAELILAINDVHSMGYVHRDIKPDNVLLDRCGHLKLADFGSAAKLNQNGFVSGGIPVGTPDYIAPEALQSFDCKSSKNNGQYGRECDYWSLGILAYELTIGQTPFTGQSTSATYSKIINHPKTLKFPADLTLTQAYINLVKSLLIDKNCRLSYDKIIKHALFKNVDFNNIRDQVPPYVPKISSVDDTSNFSDLQRKKKEPNIENFKSKTQFNGKNLPFIGFTYTTELSENKENYRSSIKIVSDDQVEKLRGEIEELHKKLVQSEAVSQDKDALERKLEEKMRKLESIECVRDKLERDLAANIAECQAMKRMLELERKDRCELERKALELIKQTKNKWAAEEKIKLDAVNRELEEYKERCEKLASEVDLLNKQLMKAVDKSNKHKASVENVEKLRRSSVIGLESRLEKVTSETQNKISQLQSQLQDEIQNRRSIEQKLIEMDEQYNILRNKYELSEKENRELKNRCKESDRVIESLKKDVSRLEEKSEDLEFQKTRIISLEKDIAELTNNKTVEQELQKEVQNSAVMKKQIKDLKGELNTIRTSKLTSLEELKKQHEADKQKYELELKQIKDEKSECEFKLQEAHLSLKSKEDKANTLEELLTQLQNDLSKLESGSERELVLQEQIERLEQQLVEVSGTAALEKQELANLKTKFWRLEKDISNAELDRKIVERDLKDEQMKNKELEKKLVDLEIHLNDVIKSKDDVIGELGTLNDQMAVEVDKCKVELQKLHLRQEQTILKEKEVSGDVCNLQKELQDKELKICSLLEVVDSIKCEKLIVEQKMQDVIEEKNKINNKATYKDREISTIKGELEKSKADLQNSLLNRKALREACTLLESQLVEFETIYDQSESKRAELQAELDKLQGTVAKCKQDMQDVRKQCNEEKSHRLLAETKVKRLLEDMEHQQKEITSFHNENTEFKKYSNDLSAELNALEVKLQGQDLTIKAFERQVEDFAAENTYLREENSEQLTFINSLKESNYNISQRFSEAQQSNKALIAKIHDLDALLNEKTQYINERELKAELTIQQQTKLIDFLQSKVEECGKKKKTLSDKIFGHSKKENVPPLSVALNYKDLEIQLAKEREQNKGLHQEIIKLKTESYRRNEADVRQDTLKSLQVQDEILAQIVHSPTSQKNDLYRQNSIQRMHHNIPHRFDSKLCTKSIKCAQCSNQILLGRHMSVCRECHITTHTNCASSLPRTCGLPDEFALHYSESLNRLNSASSLSINGIRKEAINVEGWVKIPNVPGGWEKHYACLTETALCVYNEPPNAEGIKPIQCLKLHKANENGKVILEPVHSEIPVQTANSDLPFIIKVETSPNSTCWPSQCLIFMTLSIEDKEKWHSALQNIFKTDKQGEILLYDTEDMEINCLVELSNQVKLLGTDTGLYTLQNNKCIQILGPSSVFEIVVITAINTVLMIAEQNRVLLSCDLKHLLTLCDSAPCIKPTLKYRQLNVNNMDGFHILKSSDFARHKFVCVATIKKLAILKYDFSKNEFPPQRILDTAQPTSCILFTEHSLIIGADKFFEVDLSSYEADEFLDASDSKLSHAVKCFQMQSFPLSIQYITRPPNRIEYLVCFNEFATFVDEYGRSTRKNDICWNLMPKAFYYAKKYLYVLHFNSVEVYKFTENTCNGNDNESLQLIKVDLPSPEYLGENQSGIFVQTGKQIKFIDAHHFDDSLSVSTETTANDGAESDRFSFTSSMVQSLDGHLSDDNEEYYANRRVKFTDL